MLCQASFQSIKAEEWIEMHGNLEEVIKQIEVKKAGRKVAGLGKAAWRKTSKKNQDHPRWRRTGWCCVRLYIRRSKKRSGFRDAREVQ